MYPPLREALTKRLAAMRQDGEQARLNTMNAARDAKRERVSPCGGEEADAQDTGAQAHLSTTIQTSGNLLGMIDGIARLLGKLDVASGSPIQLGSLVEILMDNGTETLVHKWYCISHVSLKDPIPVVIDGEEYQVTVICERAPLAQSLMGKHQDDEVQYAVEKRNFNCLIGVVKP